jgi:DNA repair exonuclease SbcCD ATPase subunit
MGVTQGQVGTDQQSIQGQKQVGQLLGGENVKVTSGAHTDLEKLVARLKSESEDARDNVAHMKFQAVMFALDTANIRFTQAQASAMETIVSEQDRKTGLETELDNIYDTYGIGPGDDASAVMQAKIDALEKAVERAIQEGKDHNESVEQTKEQRERDQAKIDAAKAELAAAQAAAARIPAIKSDIAAADSNIAAAEAVLGRETINKIVAALTSLADGVEVAEGRTSDAEREKAEKKAEALDPAVAIHEALDRIEESILRTISENQEIKV